MSDRVLIIGIDGGTWTVFGPLVEKGVMPNLKSLIDRGSRGIMRSTVPPITPPAWSTLMTGLWPQRHGILGFMEGLLLGEIAPEGRPMRPVSSLTLRGRTLLDMLGHASKRVLSVNVPVSYPPWDVHGVMVTGMMTPRGAETFTHPPALADELVDYLIDVNYGSDGVERGERVTDLGREGLVRACTDMVKKRAANVCRLGKSHPFDFGIVVFTATDRIFHVLWPEVMSFVGREAPVTDIGRLLREFFVTLDAAIGEIVHAFPDAVVLVASDHGFGPRAEQSVFVDNYLEGKGFLVRRARAAAGGSRTLRRLVRRALRRTLETLLPKAIARRIIAKGRDRRTRMLDAVDRGKSVAHFVSLDDATFGAVRIFDEAKGRFDAGQLADSVARVAEALREWTDPVSGRRVCASVRTRDEVYPDATVDFLPEIVLEFDEHYTGRIDPDVTTLFGGPPPTRIGMHRIEGMYVLSGAPFRHLDDEGPELTLADVAPTVLHLSGLAVPISMQGEVPVSLIDEADLAVHPIRKTEATESTPKGASERVYTDRQEEAIRDHLRNLGYME